ncbi:MAG: cation-translocating P-type ATPase [Methanoregulaceae archaeon]|jgi:Ca2+-transporting ATPase|nr:cation-translocating P-type ATPase [Methanoregulaceae archaeon]
MPPLDLSRFTGLSHIEAQRRLLEDGPNELPSREVRGIFGIVKDVIREPMFLLLVGAGSIYFILGDFEEGALLLSFVLVIIGITVYQERKTERALEALRNLSSPRALVIRDGQLARIAGREVVRGDFLFVSEGDRIAADALLLSSTNLSVDESLLTGESVPVRKLPAEGDPGERRPGGDDQPWLYSGTLVVQGQGVAEVVSTGIQTRMGEIGKALQSVEPEETRLHVETAHIVRSIAIIGLFLFLIVVVGYGLSRGDWLQGLLAGITLAMAILPEEFPVVLTVFLALGAWRLSKINVLARHVPALEALGATTVLCTDKTGTLTLNRMTVAKCAAEGSSFDCLAQRDTPLPEPFHELLEYAILSCKKDPFDPMEQALLKTGTDDLSGTEHLHQDWELLLEYPLSRELLAMSNVWRSRKGDEYIIAAKGAPEAIFDLCHLGDQEIAGLLREVEDLASQGLRVLGVAKSHFQLGQLPDGQHAFSFTYLGLIGFADPVRPDAATAVAECRTAGIRVAMITGDYPSTARNIARQIGLPETDTFLTGPDLDSLPPGTRDEQIQATSVFARVVPEQKLQIVESLKARGEIVAMTGDGVNDAPALKAAHIGIAMGGRGTDVAREASSLVLLDDNFASIVAGIRMGRRIYENLRKAMAYIISVHVPIAGLSLVPVLFGWPLILLPIQIVFLELIIDPACSVVFEAEQEERDIMQRPPRNPGDHILDHSTVTIALAQGFVALGIVLAIFVYGMMQGLSEDELRTISFVTIVVANLALICTNRSWSESIVATFRKPNTAFWWVIGGTVFFLGAVLIVPGLRDLFQFAPVSPEYLLICITGGVFTVAWFELYKITRARQVGL